jgi:hypothetical protein
MNCTLNVVLSRAETATINGMNVVNFQVIPESPMLVWLELHNGKRYVANHDQPVTIQDGKMVIKAADPDDLDIELDLTLELSMTRPMTIEDVSPVQMQPDGSAVFKARLAKVDLGEKFSKMLEKSPLDGEFALRGSVRFKPELVDGVREIDHLDILSIDKVNQIL